jgi:hypothetical protein
MKNLITALTFLLFACLHAGAQEDSLRHRIFMIGDAGNLFNSTHPVVEWLKKNVDWDDQRNTVIYLGDNIYPHGLPSEGHPDYAYSKAVIDAQINLVRGKKAKAYFVMGNHDWENGKIGGWQQAMNQEDYINGLLLNNVQALPMNGCPGPEVIELDTLVALTLLDSQWFLHTHEKPGPGSSCISKTPDEFSTELSEIVQSHPNQLLVVAMHHPIHTHGVHGGATYNLRHHIFPLTEAVPNLYIPLPIIGSIYPIARGIFGNIQDANHPLYRAMANTVQDVIKEHSNVVTVAGHDHSLQLLLHDSLFQIVSGSGYELSRVQTSQHNKDLIYSDVNNFGFAVLEVTKSGKVTSKFYNINAKDYSAPNFSRELFTIKKAAPIVSSDTLRPLPPTVSAEANPNMDGGWFSKLLIGENYRDEWTTRVTMPVLDLGKELGGLRPERQGGGKQTKSLRLVDSTGKEWQLRSVQKYPEAAIPPDLRQTFAKDVVEEGISASYPYGSLSMEPFTRAAGVPSLRRKLVYIPDDPRLDRFRTGFRDMPAILEEREPTGVKKTDNTDEVVLKLAKDNDDHIDQPSVLRARLLDNFVMDFDRHEDQWRWATRDTGKGKLYYAIPRDHDQVFFVSQGIIPRFAAKPWFVPELQGFKPKARNIKTFNRAARNFDRFFMSELDEQAWSKQVDTFLNAMTDNVIRDALSRQPKEIQGLNADRIISTLQKRRDYFRDDMMEYYRFISKTVSVVGSNQREQYTITKNDDGSIRVLENKIEKNGTVSSRRYERLFDPKVTQEIRIYGLGDNDRYIVEGGNSPIRVRIIGGPGEDEFINNGNGSDVIIYDAAVEKNTVSGNGDFRNRISNDPNVNRYNRLDYKYDFINPGVDVAWNIDDGLFLGAQLEVTKQGFRKEPYARRHYISGTRAFKTGALRFRYEGDFVKAIGYHDLILRADYRGPVNVTNFFGLGNDTKFIEDGVKDEDYYRVRYNFLTTSALLRRQLQSWMRIHYGASFESYKIEREENQGKFVLDSLPNGIDPTTMFETRMFAGAHFKLDINSRNNQAIPTRGFLMDLNIRPMAGLNDYSDELLRTDLDMRVYASLFSLPRLVLASRLGWGRNYGSFDFPQAYYLGGPENLRGYRRDRFAGRTRLFNNTELRFKIANFNTYLFPGSFGLLVFNDVGRVWQDHEKSSDWHVGNGVGIWLAPINRFVIAAHFTRSKEEKALPYVSFGFQF